MRKFIITLVGATFLLSSCCVSQKTAERKIKKFVQCNPGLVQSGDTINVVIRDTIITERLGFDTIIQLKGRDTLFFEAENGIKTTIVRLPGGSDQNIPLSISTDCPPDTIFVELKKRVALPGKIMIQEHKKSKFWWIIPFCIGFVLGIVAILLVIRFFLSRK